jgi:hypothetical protein
MCIECTYGCKEFLIALRMHKLPIMDNKLKGIPIKKISSYA